MTRKRDKFYIKGKTPVYAIRDRHGRFKDIQRVSRCAKLDIRKVSKKERRKRKRRKGR